MKIHIGKSDKIRADLLSANFDAIQTRISKVAKFYKGHFHEYIMYWIQSAKIYKSR